ncbi:MAG: four helix bundle protein [Deltaproteobacteria bacterium]|nr:four helix bundle protein [Deltaproteobacteria bacterium]
MTIKYFTRQVYQITQDQAFSRDFGLRDQIRRAAVSVMSNIAEGFERGGNQEFAQFLYVARGSCGEVRSQLYVAFDQGYIGQGAFDGIVKSSRRLSVMINNFVAYLKNSSMKGQKFKRPS